jgi:type IV pilus assembly protein PilV
MDVLLSMRRQYGLSMIEILVSLTIVAFALLGLLGLQARALSFQKDSFDRKSAAELVAQLSERLRANHLGVTAGNYAFAIEVADATPVAVPVCAVPAACTFAEVAARDLQHWSAELRRRIPGAAAYLQWNAADPRMLVISLAWPEPQTANAASDNLCATINGRVTGSIPANGFRCYETAVFP